MVDLYYYKLDGKKVVRLPMDKPGESIQLLKWAKWFETADRFVGKDNVGDYMVSTLFLGINHNYNGGSPILFETCVFEAGASTTTLFGKKIKYHKSVDEYFKRHGTWEEAEKYHRKIVQKLTK